MRADRALVVRGRRPSSPTLTAPLLDWVGRCRTPVGPLAERDGAVAGHPDRRGRSWQACHVAWWCCCATAGFASSSRPPLAGVPLIAGADPGRRTGLAAPGWLLTACEVGQGDAMVLSTGEAGTAVVVDTGPDPGLVDACLHRLGIGTIPLLISDPPACRPRRRVGRRHARPHASGAIAVGPGREPATAWRDIQRQAADRGIPVVAFDTRRRWSSGALALTVLGPGEGLRRNRFRPEQRLVGDHGGADGRDDPDDRRHRDRGPTGPAQSQVRPRRRRPEGAAPRLVKAARQFVRAVSPEVAVIGVGVDNDYGHPSPRALDLLSRDGVQTILRTDQEGDVSVGLVDGGLTEATRGATAGDR